VLRDVKLEDPGYKSQHPETGKNPEVLATLISNFPVSRVWKYQ